MYTYYVILYLGDPFLYSEWSEETIDFTMIFIYRYILFFYDELFDQKKSSRNFGVCIL